MAFFRTNFKATETWLNERRKELFVTSVPTNVFRDTVMRGYQCLALNTDFDFYAGFSPEELNPNPNRKNSNFVSVSPSMSNKNISHLEHTISQTLSGLISTRSPDAIVGIKEVSERAFLPFFSFHMACTCP